MSKYGSQDLALPLHSLIKVNSRLLDKEIGLKEKPGGRSQGERLKEGELSLQSCFWVSLILINSYKKYPSLKNLDLSLIGNGPSHSWPNSWHFYMPWNSIFPLSFYFCHRNFLALVPHPVNEFDPGLHLGKQNVESSNHVLCWVGRVPKGKLWCIYFLNCLHWIFLQLTELGPTCLK